MMDKEAILGQVPIFNSLDPLELKILAEVSQVQTYKKGDFIVSKEELGNHFFIVASGRVKVTAEAFGGHEMVLSILHPPEFFGEMSILDGQPRSATIVATEKTALITIERDVFLGTIKRHPQIAIKILTILCQRLRRADETIEQLRFLNATGRLIQALLKLMDEQGKRTEHGIVISQGLTHNDLASFAGTSRESIRKIMRQFQRKQYLSFVKGQVSILNEGELLRELAKSVMQ
jgi:CRP/FNR family transcriptional regulator/CRP/FNR family cyclic AMP-dependent transcriptional regulator